MALGRTPRASGNIFGAAAMVTYLTADVVQAAKRHLGAGAISKQHA